MQTNISLNENYSLQFRISGSKMHILFFSIVNYTHKNYIIYIKLISKVYYMGDPAHRTIK